MLLDNIDVFNFLLSYAPLKYGIKGYIRPLYPVLFTNGDYTASISVTSDTHAVSEIPSVLHQLVATPPSQQREAIDRYFTRNASFTHPFCRAPSFDDSRVLIRGIFRWYKIMSPKIDYKIYSIGAWSPTAYLLVQNVFHS